MSFKQSLYDQIGVAVAPAMRKIQDLKLLLVGTKTNIVRITQVADDYNNDGQGNLMGDKTATYQSEVVDNVYIAYPFNEVEMFMSMDSDSSTAETTGAISFTELMPVKMIVPFYGTKGTSARDFDQNDILVDVIYDHNGRKIPFIFTSPKLVGTIWNKHLVKKTYLLTFFRGRLEAPIQAHVDAYINSLDAIGDGNYVPGTITPPYNVNYRGTASIAPTVTSTIDSLALSASHVGRWILYIRRSSGGAVVGEITAVENGGIVISNMYGLTDSDINFEPALSTDGTLINLAVTNNSASEIIVNFSRILI